MQDLQKHEEGVCCSNEKFSAVPGEMEFSRTKVHDA
jgi:hypothetical protein